jgi:hypothetical protein
MTQTPQMLKTKTLDYYVKQIEERKIKFVDLDPKLEHGVREDLIAALRDRARDKFMKDVYEDFSTELMVTTAIEVEINEDMFLVDGPGGIDRDLVQDVYIKFKEPRLMYGIIYQFEDDDNEEDEDNAIIKSHCRHDLKKTAFIKDNGYKIIEFFTDTYDEINQHGHPSWERIFKFAEKRCGLYDDIDSDEPYEDRYGDF